MQKELPWGIWEGRRSSSEKICQVCDLTIKRMKSIQSVLLHCRVVNTSVALKALVAHNMITTWAFSRIADFDVLLAQAAHILAYDIE